MSVTEDIRRGITKWQGQNVEPGFIVMSLDVLDTLADEGMTSHWVTHDLRLWGFPVIFAEMDGWAIGTPSMPDAFKALRPSLPPERMGESLGTRVRS